MGNWVIRGIELAMVCLLAACSGGAAPRISQGEAEEIAWKTLQPFTDSRERGNWAVQKAQIVSGDALPEAFQKERQDTCFNWYSANPPPPENIRPEATYWLIEFTPLPAAAQGTPLSATAPPRIPEPFMRQALLLIDAATGQVDAFRLACVIY